MTCVKDKRSSLYRLQERCAKSSGIFQLADEETPRFISMNDSSQGSWKKYEKYDVFVIPSQGDRASEIRLLSFARPHMRAFHCSWWCFFIAFFIWFTISPLLPEIQQSLGLTKKQIWTSSIVGVGGTIAIRFLLGPLCDKYGSRVLFAIILCVASVPTAMTGLVNSASGLIILRMCIGMAGGTFVMCQYWTSCMFSLEIVGTANALVGGWGNLGASVTQLVVRAALFPLLRQLTGAQSNVEAWRFVSILPALVAVASAIFTYRASDDCPKGNYWELKKNGSMKQVSAVSSFYHGAANWDTWILFVQYACCFGVELTMNNATALHFVHEYGQSTETAAAIASIFGWLNLFARGLGGFASDWGNMEWGMTGRIWVQTVFLICEGIMVLVFANCKTLSGSILVLVIFSLFVQAAEGSSYGIVPYVNKQYMGSVSGIVGAGGNVGAVAFGMCFRQLEDDRLAFHIMGVSILLSASLSIFFTINRQSCWFDGLSKMMVSVPTKTVQAKKEQFGEMFA